MADPDLWRCSCYWGWSTHSPYITFTQTLAVLHCIATAVWHSCGAYTLQVWEQAKPGEGARVEAQGGERHHEEEVQRPSERHRRSTGGDQDHVCSQEGTLPGNAAATSV